MYFHVGSLSNVALFCEFPRIAAENWPLSIPSFRYLFATETNWLLLTENKISRFLEECQLERAKELTFASSRVLFLQGNQTCPSQKARQGDQYLK